MFHTMPSMPVPALVIPAVIAAIALAPLRRSARRATMPKSDRQRHYLAAVDNDGRAGHVASGVGGEQQQRAVEVLRVAKAAHRDLLLHRRAAPLRKIIVVDLGHDPARRDG